jgi:hypothetical protein
LVLFRSPHQPVTMELTRLLHMLSNDTALLPKMFQCGILPMLSVFALHYHEPVQSRVLLILLNLLSHDGIGIDKITMY